MAGEYPANWEWIATKVKSAAGWACEHCGHWHDVAAGRCLTVHHLDGNKSNCAEENLVALCQVCHLHIQARFVPGQVVMEFARMPWMEARGLGRPPENTGAVQPGLRLPDRAGGSGMLDTEAGEKGLREETS
jgi:hypothetical protein